MLEVVTVTRKFRTNDGRLFDNKEEAKLYEINLQFKTELKVLLDPSIKLGAPDGVVNNILYQHEKIRNLLARFAKKLPKAEKEAIREELAEAS